MKILVVSNLYPPDVIGGYELGCRQAVDALRARGHDVVAVREEHAPFGYEFARPVGVEIAGDGRRRAGVDPLTQGHAAAW